MNGKHTWPAFCIRPSMDRRSPRQTVDRPAKIFIGGSEGLPCFIRDVSQSGAKLHITWPGCLPPAFVLKDGFTGLRRKVITVWTGPDALGVRFTDEANWLPLSQPVGFGRRKD